MVVFANYEASFELLTKDLEEILEFVEPVDANAATFSHRIYGVLLRVCTEFESLAKDLLKDSGHPKPPNKMTVLDYRTLEDRFHLDVVDADFLLWRPQPRRVSPFRSWSTVQPPLSWYRDYNKVKHNREAEFPRANLGVLVEAMAGQFALTAKASEFNWGDCGWSNDKGKFSFWRWPFCMYWTEQGQPAAGV